jgi:hypothetical protein
VFECAICFCDFQNDGLDDNEDVVCVTFNNRVQCLQCHLFHRACYRTYHKTKPIEYQCPICKSACNDYILCVNPFKQKKEDCFHCFAEKLLDKNGKITKQKMLSAISPYIVMDGQNPRDKIEKNFPLWLSCEEYTLNELFEFINVLAKCFKINKKGNLDLNNDHEEEFKAHLEQELFDLNRKLEDNAYKYKKERCLVQIANVEKETAIFLFCTCRRCPLIFY